jgi:hypothetical protein
MLVTAFQAISRESASSVFGRAGGSPTSEAGTASRRRHPARASEWSPKPSHSSQTRRPICAVATTSASRTAICAPRFARFRDSGAGTSSS